jgi:hypothetical protein
MQEPPGQFYIFIYNTFLKIRDYISMKIYNKLKLEIV